MFDCVRSVIKSVADDRFKSTLNIWLATDVQWFDDLCFALVVNGCHGGGNTVATVPGLPNTEYAYSFFFTTSTTPYSQVIVTGSHAAARRTTPCKCSESHRAI
ncbi:hypothetical protein AB1N83_012524 [Pleurotus pulmonarius]